MKTILPTGGDLNAEEGVRAPRLWFLWTISRSRGGERPRPRDGDVPPLRERLGLVAEDMAGRVRRVCANTRHFLTRVGNHLMTRRALTSQPADAST